MQFCFVSYAILPVLVFQATEFKHFSCLNKNERDTCVMFMACEKGQAIEQKCIEIVHI